MRYKKWIVGLLLVPLAILLLVPGLFFMLDLAVFVLYIRPLIPAPQWQVEVGRHTGEPLPAEIYQVKGREIFFLHIIDENPGWFAMDFSGVRHKRTIYEFPEDAVHVLYMTPGASPYLCYNTRGHFGVDILAGKAGDAWLTYTGDSVVFSNRFFFVSATQANSGRQPVELHRSSKDNRRRK
ncbi:MAG: hypothetical protein FWG50_01340 [Kiritimatiellaeota bacterium]|nr:hypothetical protein [Kiritimatiellota bacterium]